MYRVFLVDDEYFSREALKNVIAWEENGCMICGEANNGMMGLKKAKELKPDIVLTDVNMPILDGLQMIEEIKKIMPDTVFAIITGYSEFEFAKRGIELGVKHFIVKPIDSQELAKKISQIVAELDAEKEKKQKYKSLLFWTQKNVEKIRRDFLEMLFDGNKDITEERFLYECENLQLPIQNGGYAVCCLKVDTRSPVNLKEQDWEKIIQEMLNEEGSKDYVLYCSHRGARILFSNIPPEQWDEIRIRSLLQKIQIKFMRKLVCTVVAGVGGYCQLYAEIPQLFRIAEESMSEIATSDLIARMLRYIHENYMDPDLKLHKIAEVLYSNYSYLSSQFAKEVGLSASQYISRFRMTKAADALRSGEDNMVKIACDVGYTDVKYFYRCFKKEFEVTPYQYIEVIRKNQSKL